MHSGARETGNAIDGFVVGKEDQLSRQGSSAYLWSVAKI
jgi:hypothetical protein